MNAGFAGRITAAAAGRLRSAAGETRFGGAFDHLFALGDRKGRTARLVLFGGLVLIFAAVLAKNLAFNLHYGRLATLPRYDDVTYLLDGLERLTVLSSEGWSAFAEGVLAHPPHAPMSTLLAMAGFALFGTEPLSAYVMNGLVLALYVATVAHISRPLGNVTERLLLVALFTIVPAVRAMVTEFRPDMAAGLFFGIALLAICSTRLATAPAGRRVAVAAFAVVTTLAKPSGIVVVLPGLGIAFVVAAAVQIRAGDVTLRQALGRAVLPVATFLVLFAPFAFVLGPSTVGYIYQTLVTYRDVWASHGGILYHATYHLFGVGGIKGMGAFFLLGPILVALDLGGLRKAPASPDKSAAIALYVVLLVIYCAMATSSEKTAYQGSLFYLPFILAVAKAAVRVLLGLRAEGRARLGRAWLAGAFAVLMLVWPLGQGYTRLPKFAADRQQVLDGTVKRIAASSRSLGGQSACEGRPLRLLVTNAEPVAPETIVFALARSGVSIAFDSSTGARGMGDILWLVQHSDFVTLSDPDMDGLDNRLPGARFAPDLLAHLQTSPDWSGETVGTVGSKPFRLFTRKGCDAES